MVITLTQVDPLYRVSIGMLTTSYYAIKNASFKASKTFADGAYQPVGTYASLGTSNTFTLQNTFQNGIRQNGMGQKGIQHINILLYDLKDNGI